MGNKKQEGKEIIRTEKGNWDEDTEKWNKAGNNSSSRKTFTGTVGQPRGPAGTQWRPKTTQGRKKQDNGTATIERNTNRGLRSEFAIITRKIKRSLKRHL